MSCGWLRRRAAARRQAAWAHERAEDLRLARTSWLAYTRPSS